MHESMTGKIIVKYGVRGRGYSDRFRPYITSTPIQGRFMNTRSLVLSTFTCLFACGCSGDSANAVTSPGPATPDQVNATASITFDPPTLTTKVGHVITFAFGSVGHNVIFTPVAGAPANIPGTVANTSVTRTFNTAGTYAYTCTIHPGMNGTVVVQ
jgi:plastocyanin